MKIWIHKATRKISGKPTKHNRCNHLLRTPIRLTKKTTKDTNDQTQVIIQLFTNNNNIAKKRSKSTKDYAARIYVHFLI